MKKILSFLLAISLVISMIPMAFAETAGTTPVAEKYEFIPDVSNANVQFVKASSGSGYTTEVTVGEGESAKKYFLNNTYAAFNATASRKWRIFDMSDTLLEKATSDQFGVAFRLYGAGKYLQMNTSNAEIGFAFSLQTPATAGFYIPEVSVYKDAAFNSVAPFTVYMNKYKNGENELEDYTGSENQISTTKPTSGKGAFTQVATSAIYTKPDEEVITALQTSSSVNQRLYSITLNPILDPELNIASEAAPDGTITFETTDADKTATITSTTVSSKTDATIKDMAVSKNFITYESSNKSVATVTADGTITAGNTVGTAKIWAQSSDGKVKSNEITVTVKEPGVKVVYDLTSFLLSNKTTIESDGYKTINYTNTNGFYEFAAASYSNYYSWNYDGSTTVSGKSHPNTVKPFASGSDMVIHTFQGNCYGLRMSLGRNAWFALKIYVPKTGTYTPKVSYRQYAGRGADADSRLDFFLIKVTDDPVSEVLADSKLDITREEYIGYKPCQTTNSSDVFVAPSEAEEFDKSVNLDAGEYYLVYRPRIVKNVNAPYANAGTFILDGGDNTVPIISSLTVVGNQVTATAAKMSDNTNASDVTFTYAVADDDVDKASVDANGVVTGKANGKATIIATATKNGLSSSKSIEVDVTAPEDPELKAAFDAVPEKTNEYVAPTVLGLGFDGTVMKAKDNENGTFTLTAATTNGKGEKFLYWAVGNTDKKRIISFENVITNYVPAGEGRNYLIAVYEGDIASDKNEYYNQNGQLIAKDTTAPDLPSMAGYGEAKRWEQYDSTNIYVAQYDKTEDDRDEVTVTVVGGNGTATVLFGNSVTCTATGDNFKCWTKSDINGKEEIVSVDATYTFKAWEDCTVTATYAKHTPLSTAMKIIIDSFTAGSETGVMAEFIGLGSAVEKGIMFDDGNNVTKIAMTTSGNQFSVIADKAGTYTGYAIIKNATDGYTLITDGSYPK